MNGWNVYGTDNWKEPSIEENFATRVGSAFTFHWLNVEYKSNVIVEEVYHFIPHSVLNWQRRLSLMYVPVCVMCVNIWRNIHKYLNPFYLNCDSDNCFCTRAQETSTMSQFKVVCVILFPLAPWGLIHLLLVAESSCSLHTCQTMGKCNIQVKNCFLCWIGTLTQECTNPRCQVTMVTEFCTVLLTVVGSSVWNLFHETF